MASGPTLERAAARCQAALALVVCLLTIAAPATADPAPSLSVDLGDGRHRISPDIYGMNFADPTLAAQIGLPVDRWGGNSAERYNFREGVQNTAADYYFENVADCFTDADDHCATGHDRRAYRDTIARDRAAGARTLIALPMAGQVARGPSANYSHPLDCSFPSSAFPLQQSFDPYDTRCGDGRALTGRAILGDEATAARTSIPWGPADDGAWIDDLKSRYGDAAHGGVGLYELGNEPSLWDTTHRDIHPSPTTYDELWQRSRDLAEVVKRRDPGAKVLGLSEWGWPNYFCSAADDTSDGCQATDADRAAHGGVPLAEWFLQQARDYERAHGTRLVDYLDLHYYRQGGRTTDVTRSLWDATYTDESFIRDKVELIPRMRRWVHDDYPGTKLSLSEYDLSTGDRETDVLIQADALGIFGREGLDLAARWDPPKATEAAADAFRAFRDYDGAGGRFGDVGVSSVSGDQSRLAVYGAERTSDRTLTLVVVNKTQRALTGTLALGGVSARARTAGAWRWTSADGALVQGAALPLGANGIDTTWAPRSINVVAVPLTRCLVPRLTGLTLARARRLLSHAGCRTGSVRRVRSRRARGRVAAQSPAAGVSRKPGSRVALRISRGR
jgi:hypothetical protein